MSTTPVRALHLLTLGEVRVRPKNIAGTGTPMLWWTLTARTWSDWLPVHAVVIEHERGNVLFDTGQSPHSVTDPDYYPAGVIGWIYRRQAEFRVDARHTLHAELERVGVPAATLSCAVVSHLHQDHAGNVAQLGGIPILCGPEDAALFDEDRPEMHGVMPRHVRPPGVDYRAVEFEPRDEPELAAFGVAADVHGDGTLLVLPTPGHSAGSVSLLVRTEGAPPALLLGDVTYDPELLLAGIVPDTGAREVQLETARRIRELAAALPGLRLIAAHDPRAAERLDATTGAAAG